MNLIPFNPIADQDWRPSTRDRIRAFHKVLVDRGLDAEVRQPRGRDIDAACGQLRARAKGDKELPVVEVDGEKHSA